ncbi:MAG TPA: endonuclease III, partial [Thermomicrobiales bacterium]|nr:endonuclease III [Thermomicrobiales bacterium]
YGPRPLTPNGDPVGTLVRTILSQSTTDRNSSAAYASLRETYPAWDEVIDAPTDNVAAAIRMGGLSRQKAPRIQQALRSIFHLDTTGIHLDSLPVGEAMALLTGMAGVGPKTAACVLLFALGMPVFPVDTHIGRVMTRIGIVPDHTSTATKQRMLTDLAGPHPPTIYAAHVETIEHGRRVCQSRRPKCEVCVLQDVCDYFQQGEARATAK